MKKQTPSIFNVGISSIMIVFILLSLVSFATLALITARSDYMLSQKYADRIKLYYEAENMAIQKWNELDEEPQGSEISYQIPIGDTQQLNVSLVYSDEENHYKVTSWKTESTREWRGDESLNLYPGS